MCAVFKGAAFNTVFLADLEILVETEQEIRNKEQRIRNEKGRRCVKERNVFMFVAYNLIPDIRRAIKCLSINYCSSPSRLALRSFSEGGLLASLSQHHHPAFPHTLYRRINDFHIPDPIRRRYGVGSCAGEGFVYILIVAHIVTRTGSGFLSYDFAIDFSMQ